MLRMIERTYGFGLGIFVVMMFVYVVALSAQEEVHKKRWSVQSATDMFHWFDGAMMVLSQSDVMYLSQPLAEPELLLTHLNHDESWLGFIRSDVTQSWLIYSQKRVIRLDKNKQWTEAYRVSPEQEIKHVVGFDNKLIIGMDQEVIVMEFIDQHELRYQERFRVAWVDFASDGQYIYLLSEQGCEIWDIDQIQRIKRWHWLECAGTNLDIEARYSKQSYLLFSAQKDAVSLCDQGGCRWLWLGETEWQNFSYQADQVWSLHSLADGCERESETCLYGVMSRNQDVFYFYKDQLQQLSMPVGFEDINAVHLEADKIWIASEQGVWSMILPDLNQSRQEVEDHFYFHPGVLNHLHQAVIDHLDLDFSRIKDWRKAVNRRHWLPDVSLGLGWDESQSRSNSIWGSSTQQQHYVGPDDFGSGDSHNLDVRFTWNLGDYIFDSAELSIEQRWKTLLDMREEILNKVTYTYLELFKQSKWYCRQIQSEQSSEVMTTFLRISELAARLDVLSGQNWHEQIMRSVMDEDAVCDITEWVAFPEKTNEKHNVNLKGEGK